MQISSRVYLIASGFAGCSYTHPADCNAYAVRCGSRYVIVDAGVGVDTDALLKNLQEDGIARDAVDALLLTHGHLDHAGGAAHLHAAWDSPVFASLETAAALETGDEEAISLAAAKRAGVYAEDLRLARCPATRKLNGGERWTCGDSEVTAIRTPGHSRDMLTYLIASPAGLLAFPGDTVFHDGKVLISDTWDCSPSAYASSLRTLAEYPIDGLYPGHSIWSVSHGRRHLRTSLTYVDRLLLPPNLF